MGIIICYIIASLTFVLVFGLQLLTAQLVKGLNTNIQKYLFQAWFLIAFIILYCLFPLQERVLNFQEFVNLTNLVLFLLAVIPTSVLIAMKKTATHDLLDWAILGISMEVPQRLFMQSFLYILLLQFSNVRFKWLPIVLNALIWAQFIVIQEKMNSNKLSKEILYDVLSSIWFSLTVGGLFEISGNILLPMAAHGGERLLSEALRKRMGNCIT